MTTTAPVDLSDFALWRNGFPDELFAELRREKPIFHHELTEGVARTVQRDFWMTTKHHHAVRIHRDAEAFTAADGPLIQVLDTFWSYPTIVNMDPPELNKRRKVISSAFTPRAIAKWQQGFGRGPPRWWRPTARQRAWRLDPDVADLLPMTVIGDIIGMPDDDRPRIFAGFDRILKAKEPEARITGGGAELYATDFSYALDLTAEKRRNPSDDIWSALTSAVITGEDGERLSLPANELEIFFFVLALAGSDTTKNALAAGLAAFVANPDQIERYRAGEAVRSSAIEEVLRWSTPVTYWTRSAKVDVEIDGITIPRGDRVVSMLAAANRDEDIFAEPIYRLFDIGRARPARRVRRQRPPPTASARCSHAPRYERCSTSCSVAPTISRSGRRRLPIQAW